VLPLSSAESGFRSTDGFACGHVTCCKLVTLWVGRPLGTKTKGVTHLERLITCTERYSVRWMNVEGVHPVGEETLRYYRWRSASFCRAFLDNSSNCFTVFSQTVR
jgi:hypothetical protein